MLELLIDAFPGNSEFSLSLLLVRLTAAFALGVVVAGVYRFTRSPTSELNSLTPTLVLLTIIIAMVTLAIGNSVARAFSLVGALAIVRFRTVVDDTRDTAFVIAAVAVGLAVGAGLLLVPVVGIPFIAVASFLFRPRPAVVPPAARHAKLIVRIGIGQPAESLLAPVLDTYFDRYTLSGTSTARQGAALELVYLARWRRGAEAVKLVSELNRIEGVQQVELEGRLA